jgi:iron complex outermembrane receptor protein
MNVQAFYNSIQNYIYNEKLLSSSGNDSAYYESGVRYDVFKYQQSRADLFGGEAGIDLHPHPFDWLHFENSVSFVYAENRGGSSVVTAQNRYLPSIPPLHSYSELRAEIKKAGPFSGAYMKIGFQYFDRQDRIYRSGNTETPTSAYALWDIGAGASCVDKKGNTLFTWGIFVQNLADQAYQSHLSRLKYFDNYPLNHTGRSGIYSMGRNVSVKLKIPFNVRKS